MSEQLTRTFAVLVKTLVSGKQHFCMTRYCLVLQKCLKLKYFIYSKYKLKHFLNIFSCEDAAQQVLMSVCPSVRVSSSWNSAFYNIQNVQECMQNVPECPRMYAECSRMFQNVPECMNVPDSMQSVSECSKMYAECMQIHEFACSYICLLAGPWACMQFLSMSEQLTRISQCFFLQDQWEKLLAVSICCCMIYVCYKEIAIAGCKWFWCYLMQLLDEVGFPTPISNEVCDGIMLPGPGSSQCSPAFFVP